MRMLYRGGGPEARPANSNTGLWYDKFADKWADPHALRADGGQKFRKLGWIESVSGLAGDVESIAEHVMRRAEMFAAIGATSRYFKTAGPFVTGLGRAHPVENGFAWHQTLGTAYLPGASVKGLVRDWACMWEEISASEQMEIFGSTNLNSRDRQVGDVTFWDAIPVSAVALEADVMTPHYDQYHEQLETPGDWMSPTPIPFLVVASGQVFQFGISPRVSTQAAKEHCEQAISWLASALEYIGTGGKTASGYGRFAPDEATQKRYDRVLKESLETKAQDAANAEAIDSMKDASKTARALNEQIVLNRWAENRDAFLLNVEDWIERLNSDPQPDAVRMFADLVNQHFPKLLSDPNAANKKGKLKFKPRQQKIGNEVNALLKVAESK